MADTEKASKKPAKKAAGKSSSRSSSKTASGGRRTAATTESARSSNGARPKTSPARIAAAAIEQLAELTGKPSEGVVGIERNGDGDWVVEVEVLELRRVPNTTDVLARYRITADDQGDLTGYQRVRRYVRGTPGED